MKIDITELLVTLFSREGVEERPYTFDKMVETVATFIARCFTWPTVVPPQHYETRFQEFLSSHLRGHPAWPLRDVEEDVDGASMF